MPPETRQLAFDLPLRPALGREAFLVASCNEAAVRRLDDCRRWPGRRLVLSGPPSSGKTHLAHVWAEATGARILAVDSLRDAAALPQPGAVAVDDADRVAGRPAAERDLLHLHNLVLEAGGTLLLTARQEPGRWGVALPDLRSRVLASGHVRVAPPDDVLLRGLLVKLFEDRQLAVPPQVVNYLVTRMERSFEAARGIVCRIDAAALAAGSAVTQRFAAAVLSAEGAEPK